jgi:outer membrane receptor for ferric coprogen and ferric-rhodotorulic acid
VTVIDRQRIDDFALTNVNDLLTQAVGINVERVETDRTEYTSRGFDVTNFQIDGIGLPALGHFLWRGRHGALRKGRSHSRRQCADDRHRQPIGHDQLLRKRPTKDFHVKANAQAGSWNQWRVDGDVSGRADQGW